MENLEIECWFVHMILDRDFESVCITNEKEVKLHYAIAKDFKKSFIFQMQKLKWALLLMQLKEMMVDGLFQLALKDISLISV